MVLSVFFLLSVPQELPTPAERAAQCRVVLDDMGSVGLRISDAQQLASTAVDAMAKRVGGDGVLYEGQLVQAKSMKRRLGIESDTELLDEKIGYLRKGIQGAKHRLRVRFKKRKGKHVVTVTCIDNGKSRKDVLHKKVLRNKSFTKVREQLGTALETFCPEIVRAEAPKREPADKTPGLSSERQKRLETWKPPPVRE